MTYEAIRYWCRKFAQVYANQLRRRRPKPADKWHLDEVDVKINGKKYYLWRAVDKHGQVLDILMQTRRNQRAANKFFRKLMNYPAASGRGIPPLKKALAAHLYAIADTHFPDS